MACNACIGFTMAEYNGPKFMTDPENPQRTCPVCDWDQATTDSMLELHLLSNHEPEDIVHAVKILVAKNWDMELAIRLECGCQGYQLIEKHLSK